MRVAVFSTKPYDRSFLDAANASARHELAYLEPRLTLETAALAQGTAAGFRVLLVNATTACTPDLSGCYDGCATHPGVGSHRNIARAAAPACASSIARNHPNRAMPIAGWPPPLIPVGCRSCQLRPRHVVETARAPARVSEAPCNKIAIRRSTFAPTSLLKEPSTYCCEDIAIFRRSCLLQPAKARGMHRMPSSAAR